MPISAARERLDTISSQQSKRFDSLDNFTKAIMKAVLDSTTDIMNAIPTTSKQQGKIGLGRGTRSFFIYNLGHKLILSMVEFFKANEIIKEIFIDTTVSRLFECSTDGRSSSLAQHPQWRKSRSRR